MCSVMFLPDPALVTLSFEPMLLAASIPNGKRTRTQSASVFLSSSSSRVLNREKMLEERNFIVLNSSLVFWYCLSASGNFRTRNYLANSSTFISIFLLHSQYIFSHLRRAMLKANDKIMYKPSQPGFQPNKENEPKGMSLL